jgi:hypothetical protein
MKLLTDQIVECIAMNEYGMVCSLCNSLMSTYDKNVLFYRMVSKVQVFC